MFGLMFEFLYGCGDIAEGCSLGGDVTRYVLFSILLYFCFSFVCCMRGCFLLVDTGSQSPCFQVLTDYIKNATMNGFNVDGQSGWGECIPPSLVVDQVQPWKLLYLSLICFLMHACMLAYICDLCECIPPPPGY